MRIVDYIKTQGKVLIVAAIGSLILLAVEFSLTHFLHVFYIESTIIGLAASFEWNFNAQVLLKIIHVNPK